MNREEWLHAFAAHPVTRERFAAAGAPLDETKYRLSVGFPSSGARGKVIGQCWPPEASAAGVSEIFIHPTLGETSRVADVLTHELVHAAVGNEHGHKRPFAKVAKALGLEGKMTATVAGDGWREWADPILAELGPIPHASLTMTAVAGRKKQSTRMLKVECDSCGFTFRTTQKWVGIVSADGERAMRCPDPECAGTCSVDGGEGEE